MDGLYMGAHAYVSQSLWALYWGTRYITMHQLVQGFREEEHVCQKSRKEVEFQNEFEVPMRHPIRDTQSAAR